MTVYAKWAESMITTALAGKTIKAMLVTSAYVQADAHTYRSDVTAEVSGAGYTAGGVVLTGVAITVSDGAVRVSCDPIPFGAVSLTDVGGIVFYINTGTAATDTLLGADMFGESDTVDLTEVIYFPSANGILAGVFSQ